MVQYLKVDSEHAPIVNNFINIITDVTDTKDLADCLEDVMWFYSQCAIKFPDVAFHHREHTENLWCLRGLLAMLRDPENNVFNSTNDNIVFTQE